MDPYKVLGVDVNATDEEIKNAYTKLVKKYHPDKYTDDAMKELATEKMKEINEAYITLSKRKKSSSASGTYSESSYSTSSQRRKYTGEYASEFEDARHYVEINNLNAASMILERIPLRNGEWYYLEGIINFRLRNFDKAHTYLKKAHELEPENEEYASAYNMVANAGRSYNRNGAWGNSSSDCDCCTTLLCMDCLCGCSRGCCR